LWRFKTKYCQYIRVTVHFWWCGCWQNVQLYLWFVVPCVYKKKKKKVNVYLPSLMMNVSNHLYVLGDTYTCHT
jgi:hypothetical protein